MLWNSVAIGRILKVDSNSGRYETAASGFGLYYHLTVAPSLGPVFSLLKMGGSFSFPYVKPTWGIGVGTRGTFGIRKLNYQALIPPYSIGHVSFQ